MKLASTERISAFTDSLNSSELERIYWHGARLWADTGDGELRITFGDPTDRRAHVDMDIEPAAGHWVYVGLGPLTADEHPADEDGNLLEDWPPLVAWTRALLTECTVETVCELADAAERAEERSMAADD